MELKFDENMSVDTYLAQVNGIDNNLDCVVVYLFTKLQSNVRDYLQQEDVNKIYEKLQKPSTFFDGSTYHDTYENVRKPSTEMYPCLQNLILKLKDNMTLITQLEYLNRKFSIEDTKTQVNLIIQQLHYISSGTFFTCDKEPIPTFFNPTISYDTPLLRFGHILRSLMYQESTKVYVSGIETVPICHLFMKLCYDSGITNLALWVKNDDEKDDEGDQRGTVGVISAKSDIDSAVDVFLASSQRAPWSLRKILVQESVYQQFKDALTWKCNLNKRPEPTPDIIEYNDRKFLIDFVGKTQFTDVTIEAYRTNKEVISLLNQCTPFYLSLWANDVAEINEIAYSVQSQVVWVNSFADFRGPPKISEALFSNFIRHKGLKCKISQEQRAWLKLDEQTRKEIVGKALDKIITEVVENTFYTELKHFYQQIQSETSNTFVHVGKDYVCTGVSAPPEIMTTIKLMAAIDFVNLKLLLNLLIQGHLIQVHAVHFAVIYLIRGLIKHGVPVAIDFDTDQFDVIDNLNLYYFNPVTRVIWTNSVTIFAN